MSLASDEGARCAGRATTRHAREMGIRLWRRDRMPRRDARPRKLDDGRGAVGAARTRGDARPPTPWRQPTHRHAQRRSATSQRCTGPRCARQSPPAPPASSASAHADGVRRRPTSSAHWMIVGEAPGEKEDRQGEPFVGQAGKLLDNMLRAIGLRARRRDAASAQVFIANTLKCRPPRNRNPQPEEVRAVRALPRRQIELVQPKHDPGDGPLRGADAVCRHGRPRGCS